MMWRIESPSSYACGDQSHIPAKIRNVLIPFQKRIRALQRPQKLNDRERCVGRVGRLTGARKFGGLSVSFRPAFIAPQEFTTLRNVGDEWPQQSYRSLVRAHLADTTSISRLLTYDYETQTCKDVGTSNLADGLHGRALFRPA